MSITVGWTTNASLQQPHVLVIACQCRAGLFSNAVYSA